MQHKDAGIFTREHCQSIMSLMEESYGLGEKEATKLSSVLFSSSFFFLLLSVFLLLPDEDTSVERARLYFSHRLSSIGEYIFQVLFLMCLPRQQLLAFSSHGYGQSNVPVSYTHLTLPTTAEV